MKKLLLILSLVTVTFASAKTPTHREVYNEIVKSGIMYPEIAYAQAVIESGAFRSKLAQKNMNLFGMRMPSSRKTTALGKRYGYAIYKSWKSSVADYKLWQDNLFKRAGRPLSIYEFKRYLNARYSESKNYITKLNLIIRINKNKYEESNSNLDLCSANDSVRISL